MSLIDPENGDIIENPDPEADSEITDFTNDAEDEFHINNNAENEFHPDVGAGNQYEDEQLVENVVCARPDRCSPNENGTEGDDVATNSIDYESQNTASVSNTHTTESIVSGIDLIDDNIDEEEQVEAEADICDSFEAPEAELGHDVPEAELCQVILKTDSESESTQNVTDSSQTECNGESRTEVDSGIGVNRQEENELSNSCNVPQILKLTKSESVESYEPECDQESINVIQEQQSVSVILNENRSISSNIQESRENSVELHSQTNTDGLNTLDRNAVSAFCNTGTSNASSPKKECVQNVKSSQSDENMQISCDNCDNDHKENKNCIHDKTAENSNDSEVEEQSHWKEHNGFKTECGLDLGSAGSDDALLSELDTELGATSTSCDDNRDQSSETSKDSVLTSNEKEKQTSNNSVKILSEHGSKQTNTKYKNDVSDDILVSQDSNISQETWKVIQDLQHKLSVSRQQLLKQEQHLTSNADYSALHKKFETVKEERNNYLKDLELAKKHNSDDLYLPQLKELEFTISQQQQEIRGLRDKLSSHDAAAKRAINALQAEMKNRTDQITKAYKEAVAEKDTMVVKYAQAEKNNLGSLKNIERLESKLRDAAKDKDALHIKIKDLKIERTRLGHELDLKSSEAVNAKKESEKLKEQVSSADVRIKWAQNKLKAELDGHKDTKANLEKTYQRLKEAKEETEQIRKNCQEIIKTYQESEEIKSNNLDQQLKKKETELLLHQTENKDKEELYTTAMKELEQLKIKHRETLAELHTYQDKTQCLEEEHKTDEETLNKFKHMLQKQKSDNKDLQGKVEELVQLQADFKRAQKTIKSLDAEVSDLKISNKDLMIEMEACRKRESEKLELTEKLSAKNAELQSDNSLLNDKVMSLSVEVENLRIDVQSKDSYLDDLSKQLSDETRKSQQEIKQLTEKHNEKAKKVDELATKIDDEKDEIKTLKRKHVNSIKDLTRQLQQARRKLEVFEANGEKDTTSLGSRTSSTGSLNTLTNGDGPNLNVQQVPHHTYRQSSPPEQEYPVITEQVEPDKQMLIERIVKLQRIIARRNEKIEFVEDHAHQLIDELQKKNKIIQMYALREEGGMLTDEAADASKAQLARKHSIMGSVYSSHQTDGTMTFELSLEINRKLQAVLEDTLLKNMTLKESLDTLGEEISRLSQENRNMQIQLGKQKR